jgi:hypothetical protein
MNFLRRLCASRLVHNLSKLLLGIFFALSSISSALAQNKTLIQRFVADSPAKQSVPPLSQGQQTQPAFLTAQQQLEIAFQKQSALKKDPTCACPIPASRAASTKSAAPKATNASEPASPAAPASSTANAETSGAGAPSGGGTANPEIVADIKKIVDAHPECASAAAGKGKKVGTTKGFVYGTAMAFARTMCREDNDPIKQAISNPGKGDALQIYGGELGVGGSSQSNDAIGQASMNAGQSPAGNPDSIRKTYLLLLAHAQIESDGNFTEGKDVAGQVQTPAGAEAGAWQTSYDVRGGLDQTGKTALESIEKTFMSHIPNSGGSTPANQGGVINASSGGSSAGTAGGSIGGVSVCMNDIFSEGIQKVNTRPIEGSGPAADFQRLNRQCPAASAEIAAFAIRQNVAHFGPLKRKEVIAPVQCDKMLEEVAAKAKTSCPSFAVPGGSPSAPATISSKEISI